MSRAASTDPDIGQHRAAGLLAAGRRTAGSSRSSPSARWASSAPGRAAAAGGAPGVSPQVTGSLRSTPRGSNMTMSKSSSRPGVSTLSSLAMSSTPDTPGPPGSITSEPMRSAGTFGGMAGDREGDRLAVVRVGIVERHDQVAALQVAVAGGPVDRRDRRARSPSTSWCSWSYRGDGGSPRPLDDRADCSNTPLPQP